GAIVLVILDAVGEVAVGVRGRVTTGGDGIPGAVKAAKHEDQLTGGNRGHLREGIAGEEDSCVGSVVLDEFQVGGVDHPDVKVKRGEAAVGDRGVDEMSRRGSPACA